MKRSIILITLVFALSCTLWGSDTAKQAQSTRLDYYDITIGDAGNESMARVPFDFYWQNSLYETIFFAHELQGRQGLITRLTLYPQSISYPQGKPVRIWLGHTNQGHLSNGWIPATQLVLVYDGPLNYEGSPALMTLVLQTPFEYNGASNLVMMAERSMDTHYYSMGDQFYSKTDVITRARVIYSDTEAINPLAPPTGSSLIYIIPKVTFRIASLYAGKVSGTVSDALGSPIAGVQVILGDDVETVITDANGYYEFTGLGEGSFDFQYEKIGFYSHQESLELELNQELALDVTLDALPLIKLSGIVQNSSSEPIAGASFTLSGYAAFNVNTDAQGYFEIQDVYGDEAYIYHASAQGYAVASGPLFLADVDHDMGYVTLGGFAYPPQNAVAQEFAAQRFVVISWDLPSGGTRQLLGYQVWRVPVQHVEHPYAWEQIPPSLITETSVIDEGWNHIPNDDFCWAVKAVYSGDLVSEPEFSNILQNNMPIAYLAGSVKQVTTQGIAGASISVANTGTTTNQAGAYTMIVPVGTYDVTASARGFYPQTVEGVTFSRDMMTSLHFVLEVNPSDADDELVPELGTGLQSVYPNPFNPSTTISYSLQKAAAVRLELYSLRGQLIRRLVDQEMPAGLHSLSFDGRGLASGVYLLRMAAGGSRSSRKMLLMK